MGLISQKVTLPGWGTVHIRVLSTATRFTARWRGGELYVTIPPGVSEHEFGRALESMRPRLEACRVKTPAAVTYRDGYTYITDGWELRLLHDPHLPPRTVQSSRTEAGDTVCHTLLYGPGFDFADSTHTQFISRQICHVARHYTTTHIIPQAVAVADSLGVCPREWVVARGGSRLGVCRADGRISLSERLAFLTDELRRYIITHELAHLTHFDHSQAFHALWQQYMGKPTAPLRAALRGFPWPLPK